MPFTGDSQSSLEGSLGRRVVVSLEQRVEGHAAPSVHRIIGTLIAQAAPVPEPGHADPQVVARPGEDAEDLEDAEDAAGAAAFQASMAADLACFEGGQRIKGMAEDHQLETLARLHATALAELRARHAQSWVDRTPFSAREAVVMEVAAATGISQGELSLRLELATATPARTRFLREQVRTGATSIHRACEIVRHTRELDDEHTDRLARAVLAPTRDGSGLTGALFRQRLRRALLAADQGQAARRRAARERIGARAEVYEDGTGRLTVTNDAEKIVAAIERADTAARTARAAGDPRTLEQLRADFLTSAAITGWPDSDTGDDRFAQQTPAPAGQALVVVPVETILGPPDGPSETTTEGPSEAPCELPGHGFVTAAHAREIITAPGSIWRTLLADVTTGQAVAISPGYRPTPAMIEHVRALDGTCRGPGCTVPAARCDLDHDTPWPHGPTDIGNLTAKHRQHHRVKTTGWWDTTRDQDAVLTWHTAAGRTYTTHPKDWLDHHHPDRPAPPARDPAPDTTDPDPPPF